MPRALVLLVTGAVWALMMAALVTRELVPYLEYQTAPSYRSLIQAGPRYEYVRRGIFEGPTRIGESQTLVHPGERAGTYVVTRFQMSMRNVPRIGVIDVDLRSEILIDASYQIDTFRFKGRVSVFPIEAEGRRVGDSLAFTVSFGDVKREGAIPFEKGMTLAGSMLPQHSMGRPRRGMKWAPTMVDFDIAQGLKIVKIFASVAEERVAIDFRGQKVECYQVEFRREPTKELHFALLWVDDSGTVLREQFEMFGYPYNIDLEERRELSPEETAKLILELK